MVNSDSNGDVRLEREVRMQIGVVLERRPGVTRWAKEVWRPVSVIPFAGPADYKLLRSDDDVAEFHAASVPLTLHRADVEGYRVSLAMEPPSVFVILRPAETGQFPWQVFAVTASAYEAQDATDSAEELVEAVPMPDGLAAWIREFSDAHFVDKPFVKRRRDKHRDRSPQDGIGDKRVRQGADVYRVPHQQKPGSRN